MLILVLRRLATDALVHRDMKSATLNPDNLLLQNCPVRGSNVNVRFAARETVISASRMHDTLVKAKSYTQRMRREEGNPAPKPTFEFDGTGLNKWYYIDVNETTEGTMTWDNLGRAFEGILMCAFHRQNYHAIHFEIWDRINADAEPICVGVGEFGMLQPTAIQ